MKLHAMLRGTLASLLLAMGAMAAEPAPQGKLPDAAEPTAYRLDLTVVPERERFSGHAEIDIQLRHPATSLYIHGRDLKVASAMALAGGRSTGVTWTQVDQLGVVRLDFAQQLPAGPATLVFDYDAPFGSGAAGLYRVKVGEDWYSWTQFESIDARAAFPSFDEPGFKTPFTVTLTTRPGFLALSNAPETGAPVPAGELVKHRFAPTLPLPTYLVAFVVGPFIAAEGVAPPTKLRNRPLPLRIVATRNHAGRLDYALRETPRIVELLEEYFGQPFPYPKLDQIASPIMPGAMENAGADIYGDNILLLADAAPTTQKQSFGMIVAHELSHQWFGDLVTPAWWDDIWLNESFANWMGYRIGNEWRPELNIGVGAIDEAIDAMALDALKVGRPIREPILASGEIDSAFDAITYGKGGQIVAMIAGYLGDAKFREGVRLHLRRRPYGSATTDDFFDALATAAGDPRVLASLRSFVVQQGLPVVELRRDGDGYSATQRRYIELGGDDTGTQWIIPFCLRRGATTSCTLIDRPEQAIEAKGSGPVIPNAGGTGYYRYYLPKEDWEALIGEGASMPAGEALNAIGSLWAQFRGGKLDAAPLLRAMRVFADNPDSNVALEGGLLLASWKSAGSLPAAAIPDMRKVIAATYVPKLAAMGFNPAAGAHAGDAPDSQKLRQQLVSLVASQAADAPTRAQLATAARAWLAGDANALDPAFYGAAFSVLLEDGGIADTRALYERVATASDELFRSAALRPIGGTGRAADARWLISQLGDARLRPSDRLAFMSALMGDASTRDLAFDWLKAHYDEFARGTGLFGALSIPRLPRGYCSAARATEIERLMLPKVQAAGRGELEFRRMLENIRACDASRKTRGPELAQALKRAALSR